MVGGGREGGEEAVEVHKALYKDSKSCVRVEWS